MFDIDGNEYNVIRIGDLHWTVENLKTTKYNDGTDIKLITDNEEWEHAGKNNIPAYCYYCNDLSNKQKYGALYNYHAVSTGKLIPEGWRIPVDEDWNERCLITGTILSGYRSYDGNFNNIGDYGFWWNDNATFAYFRNISYNFDGLAKYNYSKGCGFSVRVVRDV